MTCFGRTLLIALSALTHAISSDSASTPRSIRSEGENVDEFTILINSSFIIIEELEANGTDSADTDDASKPMKKRGSFRKIGPSSCRTFSLGEKYRILEDVGARNQLYMAETPDEASRGFVTPTPELQLKALADTVNEDNFEPYCNQECELIRTTLENALKQRRKSAPTQQLSRAVPSRAVPFSDTGPKEVDEGFGPRKGCALETFVPLGNCTEPGDEVSWAHEQLCSMCRGIYMLGENCFPTFFNSVHCNQQETGCIFDNFSDRAHGLCQSETLALRVLRNRGDDECEDWVIEQIELPVACQCLLSKGSWLRAQPPKEL